MDPGVSDSYTGTGTTLRDLTSTKYTGSFVNSTPRYSTDNGGILKFPGRFNGDAYVNTTFSSRTFTPTSEKTLSVWVRFNSSMQTLYEFHPIYAPYTYGQRTSNPTEDTYGSMGILLGCNNYGDYGLMWGTYRLGGVKYFFVRSANRVNSPVVSESNATSNLVFNNSFNTWYNITSTYSSALNSHILYINGVQSLSIGTITNGSPYPYNFGTIRIAQGGVSGGNPFDCSLDGDIGQTLIYNRALTASEVALNFQTTRSRFGI